jgi:CheY-like chemotaxis protein/HPt (histidine-containing phosphotransfer) domain-containing protein
VLGLAQVLEREAQPANQRDMVQRIRSAGQSLLAILNDVLDLSKIEAGQLRIEPHPFDLGALLASLDSLMGQTAHSKGLALHITPPAMRPGPLVGDGLRLEQVLLNLTGNAIKFTDHGEVAVRVQAFESDAEHVHLRFEVSDTGIGIAPDALARLFTPFTQADAGIGRRFGGTGLGLSICKRLVELMGGTICADSQLGHGSVFSFEVPLVRGQVEPAAAAGASRPQATARASPGRTCVVDDSAMNRDLVERALALEGATATLAADGQQAVELLRNKPDGFDAVLMDVQMPVMDGLTATRQIRAELGLAELPIIAFTAGVRDDQQADARRAGANDVLPKPMDLDQMANLLARWVKTRPAPATAIAPPPAGSEAFPDIDGIDAARAARRLGGDRAMFTGLLQLFVTDNRDAAGQTRAFLAAGDREAAARRMHTLRSNAGFICALDLMASAGELEKAIEAGDTDIEPALSAIGSEIDELVAACGPWL